MRVCTATEQKGHGTDTSKWKSFPSRHRLFWGCSWSLSKWFTRCRSWKQWRVIFGPRPTTKTTTIRILDGVGTLSWLMGWIHTVYYVKKLLLSCQGQSTFIMVCGVLCSDFYRKLGGNTFLSKIWRTVMNMLIHSLTEHVYCLLEIIFVGEKIAICKKGQQETGK